MKSEMQYFKLILPTVVVNHAVTHENTLVKLEVRHTTNVLVASKIKVRARENTHASNPNQYQFQSYYITPLFSEYIV